MKIVEPKYEILTDISEGGIKELQNKIPVVFDDIYTYWLNDDQTGKESVEK